MIVLVGLALGIAKLSGPASELYPVEGDSAKYQQIAEGFETLYAHPFDGLRLWLSHRATPTDLHPYGFDSWVLQHAPAYTAFLGAGYLLVHDHVAAGRWITTLILIAGALFLYLLARTLFGPWPALLAAVLYLFWPAHWLYGPAILTELPVTTAALATSYVLVRTMRSSRRRSWFLGGVALGLLVLTKTTLRFVAVPWILFEAIADRAPGRSAVLRRGLLRLAGWGALQVVWLIFLWGFQLSPNPLGKSGDDWLWVYRGDYVPNRGWETVGIGDAYTPELLEGSQRVQGLPEDQQKGEMYKAAFLATFRRHPGGMLALMLAKAGIFWRFPAAKTYVFVGPFHLPPPARLQPAIALAALFGFALCLGTGARRWLPAVFPVYLTMLHAATHLVSRYDIPGIPFGMLYAAGFFGIAVPAAGREVARARAGLAAALARARGLAIPAAALVAGLVAWFLLRRAGGGIAPLGPWLAGAGALPIASRALGSGRLGRLRALVAIVPLSLLGCGVIADNADPDAARVRLAHPGDGVRVTLHLPDDARADAFASSEVLLDLLPSVRGTMTISVRLSGHEIARFAGRPPSGPDAFQVSPEINKAEDRYRRVLRSVQRHLEGFVRLHRGLEHEGYDYYRQWYRVPVDPALAFATRDPVLEVDLLDTQGGTVDIYLDRDAPASGPAGRVIDMPAFFENPYELSNYRFDALCSDRELADARLIRPVAVASSRVSAERLRGGRAPEPLAGEPRIRLRAKRKGAYALVRDASGQPVPAWLDDPASGLRRLEPQEIRYLEADRDHYTAGSVTY